MKLTLVQFYRAYLWVPLVLSALACLALWWGWQPVFLPLGVVVGTLAVSGIFGGVPYLLLALWATRWLHGRDEAQVRRMALRMPLLLVPVFAVAAVLYCVLLDGSLASGLGLALAGTVYIVPLGYIYVWVGFSLYGLLRDRGCIAVPGAA